MKVLNVEPQDYHIILDVSHAELEHVLTYLDRCTASPDPDNPKWEAADKFVREEFFPSLNRLSEQIKEQKS